MKRVFVFQDFKSQKFWSIEVVGTDVTVNYGKLGTAGQTQVKNYATTEEAEKAANKLIAEKTKKGYVETAEETAREMKVEAKKYTLSYDEYENDVKLLDKILKDKHLSEYKQITIGCWDYEGDDCSALLQGLIENKDKFAQIEGLFWGDIEQEEQEISWIEQADLSPLLDSVPKLKDLKIKGTNNLRLGKTSRPELRSLEIISGGMPTEVVEDILASDFPNLEKLILYVGVEDYGFEGDIEIFRPLFSKERFPKLTYLGLVNSEEQDSIVEMFLESDILPQLETMDISAGTLKDEGAQLLLDNMDKIAHLKFINMRYNYLSKDMKKQLQNLPMKIDIAETEEADEYDGELWYYPMITEKEMQIIVVSNSLSKRIEYFVEAGKHLQTEVCFMTYEELFSCLPLLRQAVIKLEPCVSDETDFLKYALLNQAYKETLQRLSEMSLPDDVCFLNTPDALLRALDKKETKEVLMDKGLKVTPMLPSPQSFDELRQLLADCGRGCFLKPRYGSGAGGIMAIRYQPNRNKWVVYTTLRQVDGVIHNTKRINRLSVEKEIIPLAEAVIQTEAILEEWIPKAQLQGENYDLRVVCRESEMDYIVVRCSKGSITNLHLNNKAHWWNELSLSEEVRQQIYFQCQEAVQSLDLQYAGVDVLIERGTDIPYIIEVNGQGDHVYQDMFAHNSIYTQQIKNIKKKYNHANR